MTTADVEAIRVLLARLGVSVEQLREGSAARRAVPTFREYVGQVAGAVPSSTRRAYESYWRQVVAVWGDRLIVEPTPLEIAQLAEESKQRAVLRRNARGGRSAAEHLIGALRCLYRCAVAEDLIS